MSSGRQCRRSRVRRLRVSEEISPKGNWPAQFSHSGTVHHDVLLFGLLGFEPAKQPDGLFQLHPQLGDLQGLETGIHTARGPIHFKSQFKDGVQQITIAPPANVKLTVAVPAGTTSETGPLTTATVKDGCREVALTAGKPTTFRIPSKQYGKYTP